MPDRGRHPGAVQGWAELQAWLAQRADLLPHGRRRRSYHGGVGSVTYTESGASGLAVGGLAALAAIFGPSPAAGIVGGSLALPSAAFAPATAAGISGGTLANPSATSSRSGSGGVVGGCLAGPSSTTSASASAGIQAGSLANPSLITAASASAGVQAGGYGATGNVYAESASAGVAAGSAAAAAATSSLSAAAGIVGGTSAIPSVATLASASAGVQAGGYGATGNVYDQQGSAGVSAGAFVGGTTTYTDAFTDAAGTAVTSHPPDAGGSWAVASAPTGPTGLITSAGRVRPGGTSANTIIHFHSFVPQSADYEASIDVTQVSATSDQAAGVMIRHDNATDVGYLLRFSQSSAAIQMFKRTAGTFGTVLQSAGFSPTTGVPFRLTISGKGSVITCKKDGVAVFTPYTDGTPIVGAGRAGFAISCTTVAPADNAGIQLDNFSGVVPAGLIPGVAYGPSAAAGISGGTEAASTYTTTVSAAAGIVAGGYGDLAIFGIVVPTTELDILYSR